MEWCPVPLTSDRYRLFLCMVFPRSLSGSQTTGAGLSQAPKSTTGLRLRLWLRKLENGPLDTSIDSVVCNSDNCLPEVGDVICTANSDAASASMIRCCSKVGRRASRRAAPNCSNFRSACYEEKELLAISGKSRSGRYVGRGGNKKALRIITCCIP